MLKVDDYEYEYPVFNCGVAALKKYDDLVDDILSAVDAAAKGEDHQRLDYSFRGCMYRIGLETAFFPVCPQELLPPERQSNSGLSRNQPWKR